VRNQEERIPIVTPSLRSDVVGSIMSIKKKRRDNYQNGIKFAKPSVTKLPATKSGSTWPSFRSAPVGSIMSTTDYAGMPP